jgi:D-xylulose reductase
LIIKGIFRYSAGDYATSLFLLSTGKVEVKSLISKKVAFRDAEDAFKATKAGKDIKILIEGPGN